METLNILKIAGRLKNLVRRENFPEENVYVDKQSTSPNAAFAGVLGKNVIILTLSLVNSLTTNQVCAVLAHEIGHWFFGLTTFQFLIFSVLNSLGFCLSTYGMTTDFAFKSFGLAADKTVKSSAIVPIFLGLSHVWPVVYGLIDGFHSIIGRHQEFLADEFAVRRGFGTQLKLALLGLYGCTGKFPLEDSWYAAWYHYHPTLQERLKNIDGMAPRDKIRINKINRKYSKFLSNKMEMRGK